MFKQVRSGRDAAFSKLRELLIDKYGPPDSNNTEHEVGGFNLAFDVGASIYFCVVVETRVGKPRSRVCDGSLS